MQLSLLPPSLPPSPLAGDGAPCDELQAQAIRLVMTVDAIVAERRAISARSAARYESGDRAELQEPSGHYMAGDAFGNRAFDWMTSEERNRFHILGLALPTSGEEQQAARERIQARIAARRLRALPPK